ncbi:MAG TPA: dihydropyrimidinase [Anaerolineae bacterium]|nr:dihydropyrimidinase [Anaerolineae bacterium]HIQ06688.1 dihydropyrimidinase [Anaerolineae bacterium]
MNADHRTLLIAGGTLVLPDGAVRGDLLIAGERIAALGQDLRHLDVEETINATGCYVLPGVIDPHTHIQLATGIYQTADDWDVGTRTAACGGVTTVIDFATQFPGQTVQEAFAARQDEIDKKAHVDYSLHMMLTNLPPEDAKVTTGAPSLAGWMADLVALGVPSVKLYTTYRPNYYQDDNALLRVFRAAAAANVVVMLHSENDAMVTAATQQLVQAGATGLENHGAARPALAEVEAVHRAIFLAANAGCTLYVVHCSVAQSVELIAAARSAGQSVIAETCPQYLLLDHTLYAGPHPEWVILQPPLRAPAERERLWHWLSQGAVSSIGTDHCEYTLAQKTASPHFTETPGGIPGLETSLPLMVTYGVLDGRLSWEQLVQVMAANPARIFGLYPRKGVLLPGSDADVVLYDPEGEDRITAARLHGVSGYTPYEGIPVRGRVKATLVRGRLVYQDGDFHPAPGWGRFVFAHASANSGTKLN